jgi:hypothetical protein
LGPSALNLRPAQSGMRKRKTREGAQTYPHGPWEYSGRKSRVFRRLVFEVALFCTRYSQLQPVF